jgi:hypothetical protein
VILAMAIRLAPEHPPTSPEDVFRLVYGHNYAAISDLLARRKLNPNCVLGKQSLLSVASELRQDTGILALLLAAGANPNGASFESPLVCSTHRDNSSATRLLLAYGAKFDARDEGGMTALGWAALGHCSECVRLLLRAGANVNAVDNVGMTPFLYGITSLPIVRLMIPKHPFLPKSLASYERPIGDLGAQLPASESEEWAVMSLLVKTGVCFKQGVSRPSKATPNRRWEYAALLKFLGLRADPRVLKAKQTYGQSATFSSPPARSDTYCVFPNPGPGGT